LTVSSLIDSLTAICLLVLPALISALFETGTYNINPLRPALLNGDEMAEPPRGVSSKTYRRLTLPSAAAPYGRSDAFLALKLKTSFEQ